MKHPRRTPVTESKFIRFVPDQRGGGTLDCSIVTYRNGDGVTVDLIGAVHVADKSFYEELNKHFEQYDSLLYEMVKPKEMEVAPAPGMPGAAREPDVAPRRARQPRSMGWVGTMQRMLKETLDLSFQLDEINYTRPNFVHADLDTETFLQKQAERGESLLTMMLQAMFQDMKRESTGPVTEPGIMDLVEALQSPDRSRRLKLLLAKHFANMDDMMAMFEGPDGSVILTERNKAALNVLTKRVSAGDRKIGIFYGAAHLAGMEKMLILDLGFKQVGEPKWITAWDMKRK
jgi:TraB/PrgY/gumN family